MKYVDKLRDDDLPGAPGDADHSYLGLMKFDFVTMVASLGGDASGAAGASTPRDVVDRHARTTRNEPTDARAVARAGRRRRVAAATADGPPVLERRDLDDRGPATFTGIVGPSGSGKTTLLRVLLGSVRPDAGQVTAGRAPRRLRARRSRPSTGTSRSPWPRPC